MKIEGLQRPARIALASVALTLFACENQPRSVETNLPTTAAEQQSSSELVEQLPQDIIDKHYPEIKGANFRVKSTFELEGNTIPTKFYNFTEYSLNEKAVSKMYQDMQFYATLPDPLLLPNPLGPDNSQIILVAEPNIKSRTIVILSPDMPLPFSNHELTQRIRATAATKKDANGDEFTFIIAVPGEFDDGSFQSARDNATLSLGTEICQQIFIAGAIDSAGNLIMDAVKAQYAQEYACNSFGAAFASRTLGLPFSDYLQFAKTHRVTDKDLIMGGFPEDAYNSLGVSGPVIQ